MANKTFHLLPVVNKAKRPKFEVHLKIYDLNNVPLVHGSSHIKWHLPHSIHGEHRGRTPKSPIANHRVEYNYGKIIPVRLAIDKSNSLAECPIELEVLQEFPTTSAAGATREERITLGRLTLNLAEYVEESEAFVRDSGFRVRRRGTSLSSGSAISGKTSAAAAAASSSPKQGHPRRKSSLSTTAPLTASTDSPTSPRTSSDASGQPPTIAENGSAPRQQQQQQQQQPQPQPQPEDNVEEGIIRRYLMTDSKINSTLKIGILMVQVDGERNFVAPPLKTAPVFGMGISSSSHPGSDSTAEFGQHFQDAHPEHDAASLSAQFSGGAAGGAAAAKTRDTYELQDLYRRALAASWAGAPGALTADECIEDIFQGGDGFGPDGRGADQQMGSAGEVTPRGKGGSDGRQHRRAGGGSGGRGKVRREDSADSVAGAGGGGAVGGGGGAGDDVFLRPGPDGARRGSRGNIKRNHSRQGSGESGFTVRHDQNAYHGTNHRPHRRSGSQQSERGSMRSGLRSRSESMTSLANTLDEERGRSGFKSARELNEWEVREDLVAWRLPGKAS